MLHLLQGRLRWTLIFWMFVMSAIAYLDRVNISIAGKAMEAEYHFNNEQLGIVFSAFVLGYALFQVPGGRLADRFGPRWTITAGVIWWGIFTALTAAVPITVFALPLLVGTRFLLGAGEAVVYPSSNRLVANWIPSPERGVANGIIFAGVGIGAGIAPPLIRYVLENYGWQWSFWVSAVIGCAAGVVWYFIARDTPRQHPWIDAEESAYIERGLPQQSAVEKNAPAAPVPWKGLFTSKEILAVTFSYFAYGYAAYIFFTWFFIYLSSVRGLSLKTSSYYAMLPFIAMTLGSLIGGWISDRLTHAFGRRIGRCGIAVVGIGLSAVFIALGMRVASPQLASIVLAGGAGALYLSQSSFWSVTADVAGPWAGTVSGLMNMGGQIGGALTAAITPVIAAHYGWSASFLTAAALCAVGSLAWLIVDPSREVGIRREAAEAAPLSN